MSGSEPDPGAGRPGGGSSRGAPGVSWPTGDTTAQDRDDTWLRPVVWIWHGSYAFLIAVTIVSLASADARWPVYPLLAALSLSYAFLMVPALSDGLGELSVWYIRLAIPITLTIGYISPVGLIMLYALLPQAMGVLEGRRVRLVLLPALGAAAIVVALAHDQWSTANLGAYAANVIAALAISVAIGGVIQLLIRESFRRGELIEQLQKARAGLDAAQHEAGVHAERERLAREIHDTLAQGFTSILMLVQAADAALGPDRAAVADAAAVRRSLALTERTARENLAEARALVAALAPVELDSLPLDAALGRITGRCGEELGITATATVTGPSRPLPAAVQVVLLRGAQEALANVRKHAAADRVEVRLVYRTVGVMLEVIDDGCGFDPGAAGGVGGGFGLRGLRARVEEVDGTVEITSSPGSGTRVRLELP